MGTVTIRVRSLAWFVTGAMLATAVTLMFVNAWRADAAPGDTDTTLVPITPCRLVDSRKPGQSPLAAGETRTVTAHGTNGPIVGSQCTIPTDAVALSLNVTALDATALTFWTIWQTGTPRPDTSSLNPSPGQPPTPNAVSTPISATGQFDVFNESGSVGILIDVNGYYTKTSLQELAARVTANESNIAALDLREPFAVTARDDDETVSSTVESVVSVTLTAPAAGHVTVNSTAVVADATAGDDVVCSINAMDGPPLTLDPDHLQQWESPGPFGDFTQMAGTRRFEVAAGPAGFELRCRHSGVSGTSLVLDSVLTAIYTPAP